MKPKKTLPLPSTPYSIAWYRESLNHHLRCAKTCRKAIRKLQRAEK